MSVFAETLFSVLVAPVLAMLHSRFVIGTLLGQNVEWAAQDRGDVETPWRAAIRWHLGITLLGVVWSLLLWWNERTLFWWLSPVLAGWLLCIPLSVWSSKVKLGQWARRRGLFLTPEEVSPPLILRRFHQFLCAATARPWATAKDGLSWVLGEPEVRSVHLSLLPREGPPSDPLRQHRLEGLRLKVQSLGAASLLPKEKRELLCDAESIEHLSRDTATESAPSMP